MSGNTTATLNFYAPPPDGAAPFNHVDPPPPGLPIRNYTTDSRPVPITDIRGSESSFQNLDRDAFALISGEPPSAETAFTDDDSIKKNYYPELEALLLKAIPGANKEGSGVQGGRVAHTAFAHPGTAEDAEGRESIEVRALVFGP
ncbi:hypothetical protein VdG1_00826 [Verticillium dahliae VDG1]|nr:hypothetical protein VdG1_00826 [Verticillium dahliae VDG1]